MQIEVEKLSRKYCVKKINKEDIPAVYKLCKGNPIYYEYMKMQPTYENLEEVITELPPGKSLDDKYFIGFWEAEKLVAIMDLIMGFPNDDTAFVGWFMMERACQGKEIGSQIVSDVFAYLKDKGVKYVRLGCIDENQQGEAFWLKNGFLPTGDVTETEAYRVVVMRREL